MSETKTPRTDKQVFPKGAYGQSAVSADFARQLERELALAVNALKNIIDHHFRLAGLGASREQPVVGHSETQKGETL